jgi:hypothetical protein
MKMGVFWDVVPCSLVEIDRLFRGAYCLHHQGDRAGTSETSVSLYETTPATSQKTVIFNCAFTPPKQRDTKQI